MTHLTIITTALLLLFTCCLVCSHASAITNFKHQHRQGRVACFGACGTVMKDVILCPNGSREARRLNGSDSSQHAATAYYAVYGGTELQLGLLNRPRGSSSFTVAKLYDSSHVREVHSDCRLTDSGVTVKLDSCCDFRLLPRSLAAFAATKRLTLQLKFAHDQIPTGLFTRQLASLQNLQIESPVVTDIEPGAFMELKHLTRLHVSNLRVSDLSRTTLQGLNNLRHLELPGNSLVTLDAASFAASPGLESIVLSTTSNPVLVTVAPDTFCGLKELQLLQYSGLQDLSCCNFPSPRIRLTRILGAEHSSISCAQSHNDVTSCKAEDGHRHLLTGSVNRTLLACGKVPMLVTAKPDTTTSIVTSHSTQQLTTQGTTPGSSSAVTSPVTRSTAALNTRGPNSTFPTARGSKPSDRRPTSTSVVTTPCPASTVRHPDQSVRTALAAEWSAATTATVAVGLVLLAASVAVCIVAVWRQIRRHRGPGRRSLSLQALVVDQAGDNDL